MMITKVLIAVDASDVSDHAAAYGFDIARKFNAAVGLVNIVEPIAIPQLLQSDDAFMGFPGQGTGIEELEIIDIRKNQSNDIVNKTIQKLGGDLQVTHFNEYGSTGDGILECSKEFNADLLVLGTHSRTGFDRLLMGSIAEYIVRHSAVPVLVVPMKEEKSL